MADGIIVDFDSQVCDEVRKWLPHDHANSAVVAKLSAMKSGMLLIQLFNWLDRLVHSHPRHVCYSRELLKNPRYKSHLADIGMIAIKIMNGADLNAHLSRSVKIGFSLVDENRQKALTKRKDLDMLLNDWGVHHLHLSGRMEADGFVARGKLLLFAIFTSNGAYFLDIFPHGEWTNQRIVEVAVRNWPEKELFLSLSGLLPGDDISSSDRKVLRDKGINSTVKVDGTAYISRTAGISTAGTSSSATMRSIKLRRELDHIAQQLARDKYFFRNQIERAGRIYPNHPEFRLMLYKGPSGFGFGIQEMVTSTIIELTY